MVKASNLRISAQQDGLPYRLKPKQMLVFYHKASANFRRLRTASTGLDEKQK